MNSTNKQKIDYFNTHLHVDNKRSHIVKIEDDKITEIFLWSAWSKSPNKVLEDILYFAPQIKDWLSLDAEVIIQLDSDLFIGGTCYNINKHKFNLGYYELQ